MDLSLHLPTIIRCRAVKKSQSASGVSYNAEITFVGTDRSTNTTQFLSQLRQARKGYASSNMAATSTTIPGAVLRASSGAAQIKQRVSYWRGKRKSKTLGRLVFFALSTMIQRTALNRTKLSKEPEVELEKRSITLLGKTANILRLGAKLGKRSPDRPMLLLLLLMTYTPLRQRQLAWPKLYTMHSCKISNRRTTKLCYLLLKTFTWKDRIAPYLLTY